MILGLLKRGTFRSIASLHLFLLAALLLSGASAEERMLSIRGQQVPQSTIVAAFEKMKGQYIFDGQLTREPITRTQLKERWTAASKTRQASQKKPNQRGRKPQAAVVDADVKIGRLPEPELLNIEGKIFRRSGTKTLVVETKGGDYLQINTETVIHPNAEGVVSLVGWRMQTYGKDNKVVSSQVRLLTPKGSVYVPIYRNVTFTPAVFMGFLRRGKSFPELAGLLPAIAAKPNPPSSAPVKPTPATRPDRPSVSTPGRATPKNVSPFDSRKAR